MMMMQQPLQHLVPMNDHAVGMKACEVRHRDVVLQVVNHTKGPLHTL
jgi:hypothetical protein